MPTFAEIYAACLYTGGEGYPLWNPSPLRLGDVGYVRDGSFITLYNAIDGPGRLSDAASIPLARRSDHSDPLERTRRDTDANGPKEDAEDAVEALTESEAASRRLSLSSSTLSSSPGRCPIGLFRSPASDPLPPSAAKKGSPTFAHRALRSGTPPEGPRPPMRLTVDHEAPQIFDMGPRTSSSYNCLGVEGGTAIPGTPVSIKIGFQSSGGDGAILISRDPTERTRLKHIGVLKAHMKAHNKWMIETYGQIEAIGTDDLALIYGQDRTSDWAVAVSRDAARGAKVEFEIFGCASAGFWGNWSHTLSACQRGPHRTQGASGSHNVDQVEPPSQQQPGNPSWGLNIESGVVNTSFSISSPSSDGREDHGRTRGGCHSKPTRKHSVTWSPAEHAAPDQSISIRRITLCKLPGLGFLPAWPRAAAEPPDPHVDRTRDQDADAVARQDASEAKESATQHCFEDPLKVLHQWIQERGDASLTASIASDDDCLLLIALLGHKQTAILGLRQAVRTAADQFARIMVDDAGFATVSIEVDRRSRVAAAVLQHRIHTRPTMPFEYAKSPVSDIRKGSERRSAASRAVAKAGRCNGQMEPGSGLLSWRFSKASPCGLMYSVGSLLSSLIL